MSPLREDALAIGKTPVGKTQLRIFLPKFSRPDIARRSRGATLLWIARLVVILLTAQINGIGQARCVL